MVGAIALYLIVALHRAIDFSEKLAEDRLLMEKRTATLFAELQHRVANNLAFLVAVLNRQLGREVPAALALESIRDRLIAMGRTHRRLYDPANIDKPIGPYLSELRSEQIAMCGMPVTHTFACDEIVLQLDKVVPVALILSELVANCIKHAFKDRGSWSYCNRRSPIRRSRTSAS